MSGLEVNKIIASIIVAILVVANNWLYGKYCYEY